jgi:hypothetical protein
LPAAPTPSGSDTTFAKSLVQRMYGITLTVVFGSHIRMVW